jgi:hypothetical protein
MVNKKTQFFATKYKCGCMLKTLMPSVSEDFGTLSVSKFSILCDDPKCFCRNRFAEIYDDYMMETKIKQLGL